MKKIATLLLSLAITAGMMTSCKKEQHAMPLQFTASMENCTDIHNAKTTLNGTVLNWTEGDQILVIGFGESSYNLYDYSELAQYSATPNNPATSATFNYISGDGNVTESLNYFAAIYPFHDPDDPSVIVPETQESSDGSLSQGFPMLALSNPSDPTNLKFKNLCGVLKLHLQSSGKSISSINVSVSDDPDTYPISGYFYPIDMTTYDFQYEPLSNDGNGGNSITMVITSDGGQSIDEAHDFYIYLPAGEYHGLTLTITATDGSICSKGPATGTVTIERSKYSTISLSGTDLSFIPLPTNTIQGALNGWFAVSPTKRVHFSQGNLQYNCGNQQWLFATNQWDFVGHDNYEIIVPTYTGLLDLFGWGTGTNPRTTSSSHSAYGSTCDWGDNPIVNGGNTAYAWSVLTSTEYNYLLTKRPNAANLCLNGKVHNIQGFILLPDNWKWSLMPASISGLTRGTSFNDQTISDVDWATMEAAGAVFMPYAGGREGSTYFNEPDFQYWTGTSSIESGTTAVRVMNDDDIIQVENGSCTKSQGCAVRMVVTDDYLRSVQP